MKKTIIAALALTSIAPVASADMLAGVYVEARASQYEMETTGFYDNTSNGLNVVSDKDTGVYASVRFEHPIPLVPNVKLSMENYELTGVSNMDFSYGGATFNNMVGTTFDTTETTATLYYEFLDFDVVSFDAGISLKKLDIDATFAEPGTEVAAQIEGVIPMAYAAVQSQLPFSGFTAGAQIEALRIGDHSVQSVDAYVGYYLLDNMAVDLMLKVGYADKTIDVDDMDNFTLVHGINGPYIGLVGHL